MYNYYVMLVYCYGIAIKYGILASTEAAAKAAIPAALELSEGEIDKIEIIAVK